MIFEVELPIVKKALSTIKSTLTATELRKSVYSEIQIHVEKDSVYFSLQVEDDLEYQVTLSGAEPILEGKLSIDIKVLLDTIKPFSKESPSLLFERDGAELQIDDGVTEPEIIVLTDNNELENGFRLDTPEESISINKEWIQNGFDIARLNSRTTFFPATSGTYLQSEKDKLAIRSFNLTSMYESNLTLLDNTVEKEVLLDKNASSRLLRLLKGLKESDVKLTLTNNFTYLSTESIVFKFTNLKDEKSIEVIKSLPFEEVSQTIDSYTLDAKELTKKLIKPKEIESFSFTIEDDKDLHIDDENVSPMYPIKLAQRLVKKWKKNITISHGLKEENSPLVFTKTTNDSNEVFVLAGLKDQ